ncbi:MAG: hypothetical protein IJ158_04050 [Treponema sp.]|nr:hypothetical protein [Treponema sp.]
MAKITEKEYSNCYEQAKLVYEKKKSKLDAVNFLSKKDGLGMKKSSATYYINAYLAMRDRKVYQKTINNDATKYYLEHIYSENGKEALEIALQSLQKHLEYYSKQGKGELKLLQVLHDYFVDEIINRKV